jgi:ABC-type amino acid transport substrate-binding protein
VNELIAKKDPAFVTVSGEEGLSQLIKMLRANRIDAFYENPAVLREWLSQNKSPITEFKAAGAPQHRPQELFVAFGPKLKEGPELTKYLDLEIKAMKKNGSFKKLLAKYHLN